MEEKKLELFSKALMILWEGFCERYGVEAIGSRVVLVDEPEGGEQPGES